jgi:hypothetical protein
LIGTRTFCEYFTYEKGSFQFFIGAEAIVKIHRGINERPETMILITQTKEK